MDDLLLYMDPILLHLLQLLVLLLLPTSTSAWRSLALWSFLIHHREIVFSWCNPKESLINSSKPTNKETS